MTGNFDFGILIVFAVAMTIVTIVRPDFLWAIIASGLWGVLLWYNLNNPLTGMAIGSQGSQFFVMVCFVGLLAPLIYTFARMRQGNRERIIQMNKEAEKENRGTFYDSKGNPKSLSDLTTEEYRAYLHSKRVRASGK